MGEWISYKEENPPIKGINYIICALDHGTQVVTMAKWNSMGFVLTGRRSYWKVTHWMMLPHPPAE